MKNITIHIGLHKTGTTFLQRNFFPFYKNVHYSNKGISFKKFPYNKCHNFLISNEALSGRPWNVDWLEGKENDFSWFYSFQVAIENLKVIFPEAHIVIVFRRHGDLVCSLYKQYIQEGGVLKFEEFYGPAGVIKESDLNFSRRLKFLQQKFSKVSVLSFEDFKEEGAEYFNSFFKAQGFDTSSSSNKKKENSSISGNKIEILRRINKYYYKSPKVLKDVLALTNLTPRRVFQKRLNFWKPQDPNYLKVFRSEINEALLSDWNEIEKQFWSR